MRHLLIAVTIGLLANVSHASLIGDTINVRFNFTSFGLDQTQSTTVRADAADELSFAVGSPRGDLIFFVDPYDSGFVVTLDPQAPSGVAIGEGNSIEFTDLDWLPTPGEVIGVDLSNNDLDRLNASTAFTAGSATVNFLGAPPSGQHWFFRRSTADRCS